MGRFIMCSCGKDSMATCIIAKEKNIRIDGVVIGEVMFDNARNISGEHPLHVEFMYNKAIPFIKGELGFPVHVIKSEKDYLSVFNSRIGDRGCEDRRGKKLGFPVASFCVMKRELKINPMNRFLASLGSYEKILGIAVDEQERLQRCFNRGEYSILAEYNVTEAKAEAICKYYGMYSDYYSLGLSRQGCWFCPNCSIKTFGRFAKSYPNLWEELRILSYDPDIVSQKFRYNESFSAVDRKVQLYVNQVDISDLGICI